MEKLLGGIFIGVFIGAVGIEILRRTKPEALEGTGKAIGNTWKAIKDEFQGKAEKAPQKA